MSFQQKTKNNIARCNGCEAHCELGAHLELKQKQDKLTTYSTEVFYPSISDKPIHTYVNKNGFIHKVYPNETAEAAIEQARKISELCDHYDIATEFARRLMNEVRFRGGLNVNTK